MKIVRNKKISEIHWSAFVAAGFCFIASFFGFKEYKEVKFLIEQGIESNAEVVRKSNFCKDSRRLRNYIDVIILDNNRKADCSINYEDCLRIMVGDRVMIKYSNDFDRIMIYKPNQTKVNNIRLYFSIIILVMGLIFLLFGNDKNKLFQHPRK